MGANSEDKKISFLCSIHLRGEMSSISFYLRKSARSAVSFAEIRFKQKPSLLIRLDFKPQLAHIALPVLLSRIRPFGIRRK